MRTSSGWPCYNQTRSRLILDHKNAFEGSRCHPAPRVIPVGRFAQERGSGDTWLHRPASKQTPSSLFLRSLLADLSVPCRDMYDAGQRRRATQRRMCADGEAASEGKLAIGAEILIGTASRSAAPRGDWGRATATLLFALTLARGKRERIDGRLAAELSAIEPAPGRRPSAPHVSVSSLCVR
jgi:hypothetical protein